MVSEAVRLYVQGLSSYRVLCTLIEQRFGRSVSRFTLNRWVDDLGALAKTPLEVSAELTPAGWGGFLGVDGKVIRVAGEKRSLLIGVDHPSQDVVHALLLPAETSEGFVRLVTDAIADGSYPLMAIVSDLGPGYAQAHKDYFAKVPLQACRVHLDRRLDQVIPRMRNTSKEALYAELRQRVRSVLYADTEDEGRANFADLRDDRKRYGASGLTAVYALSRYLDQYLAHHRVPGLPADNNITENVVKQLGKKLRLMEGFQTEESAERFIRLLIGCYRFKRFTDSCRAQRNGKAPLELAGVDLGNRDWLSFLLER